MTEKQEVTAKYQALDNIKLLEKENAAAKDQINVCLKIVDNIDNKEYYNASILILNYLDNKNFIWYKDINDIVKNQITNLFYDIENGENLTSDFFKRTIKKLQYRIKSNKNIISKLSEVL